MLGMSLPDVERWSARIVVVRGLNPGLFTGPGTNTYLIGTGPQRLLLDTGVGRAGYPSLLEHALEEACGGAGLGDVVVTHAHPDHLGGAASLLSHFGDRPIAKRPWPERDPLCPIPVQPLDEGEVIRVEGATLRAVHTPGHAPDHLCFYLEEEKALFTGDVVLGAGTSVIPADSGDMGLYLSSLRRILELDIEWIAPGHGPRIDAARAKVEAYIEHRLARETQILGAIEAGAASVEEIVELAYRDTPRVLHPAAAQSVLAHLVKLEREQRAARAIDPSGEERWARV